MPCRPRWRCRRSGTREHPFGKALRARVLGIAGEGLGEGATGLEAAEDVHLLVVGIELGGVLAGVGEAGLAFARLDRRVST